MLEGGFLVFAIEVIEAVSIRSNDFVFANSPSDTNYITVTAVPANGPAQSSTVPQIQFTPGQIWNLEPAGFDQPGLAAAGPIYITNGSPVACNYIIMNNGHDAQATVIGLLEKAGTALGQKGVQVVMTAVNGLLGAGAGAAAAGAASATAGAATGATIGSTVLPIIGSIIGAVAGWLLSSAFSVIFADCDGLVASEQPSQDINQVWLYCNGGASFTQKTNHPGLESPHGCGHDSNYNVTWSVTMHWLNRSEPVTGMRSLVRAQTHLDLFWVNAQGAIRSTWWDKGANSGHWNAAFSLTANGVAAPFATVASVARVPGHMDLFWVSGDGSVLSVWWDAAANNGNWNAQFSIAPPNSATRDSLRVISRQPTHVDVFWTGPDGSVRSAWWDQNVNNAAWSTFNVAPANSAVTGTVAAVARLPIHLDAFWVAPDGSIHTAWWDQNVNSGAWSTPFSISPAAESNKGRLTVLARTPTHIDVYWVGPDGSIRTVWWDQGANNANWNATFDIAPAGSASTSSPERSIAAVAAGPWRIDLFWVAEDGSVKSVSWGANTANNSPNGWTYPIDIAPAGSAATQVPVVVATNPKRLDVFWTKLDGTVWTTRRDISSAGNAWGPATNIGVVGQNVIGSLTAIAQTDTRIQAFWMGEGGSIWGAYSDMSVSSGNWVFSNQISLA